MVLGTRGKQKGQLESKRGMTIHRSPSENKIFPGVTICSSRGPVVFLQKTTPPLRICWKHIYKHLPPATCSGSQLLRQSHVVLPLCYKSVKTRAITGTQLLSLPSTKNLYKYMLKDKVVLPGGEKNQLSSMELRNSFPVISCGIHSRCQWHVGSAGVHEGRYREQVGQTGKVKGVIRSCWQEGDKEGHRKSRTNGNAFERSKKSGAFRQSNS